MTFRANHLYGNKPDSSVQGAFNADLPLTVVAQIISFLHDDVASLARLCRTSRVLWYMTLPHLWENVTLKSYSSIRYKNEVPEGFGSASPFSMGLNALVTRNVAGLVRSMVLEGEFCAADLNKHARAGRVPESIMILNIALRAALDQCAHLEKFRWDLDVRIQPNVYAGLVKLARLESLWIRFPASRSPQPSYEIPPLPNLKSLTFTHYDPLCHPDDMSSLLFHATKLDRLVMHFSPRMREQGEPSVALTHFFRKNIASKRKIRLKTIGMYNLLNSSDPSELADAIDKKGIEHCTALNSFGGDEDVPLMDSLSGGASATHFIDERMWHNIVKSENQLPQPKSLRLDQLHRKHALMLAKSTGLERLYLVNVRYKTRGTIGCHAHSTAGVSPDSTSTVSAERSPHNTLVPPSHLRTTSARQPPLRSSTPSSASTTSLSLRDLYLDTICNVHGSTLRHLILPARWPLSTQMTARLIRSCPSLTQLAAAIECVADSSAEVLRLLVPFLTDLFAIRILAPVEGGGAVPSEETQPGARAAHDCFVALPDRVHEEKLERSLAEHHTDGAVAEFAKLRYIGLGWKVWQVGPLVEEMATSPDAKDDWDDEQSDATGSSSRSQRKREKTVYRRKITRIEERDVQHVEIWKMDSLEIV